MVVSLSRALTDPRKSAFHIAAAMQGHNTQGSQGARTTANSVSIRWLNLTGNELGHDSWRKVVVCVEMANGPIVVPRAWGLVAYISLHY
jgi:hypothetical protein